MALTISSGQTDATQRRTLHGAVYLLSGVLQSRVSGQAAAPVRWANTTFSGGPDGGLWEDYLALPATVETELAFRPGDVPPLHPINIPIRNRAFQNSPTILAAIVDEAYAWEGMEATLYVGYLAPGQTAGDLAAGDWTAVRSRGQLGSPRDIGQDAFTLPLLSRDTIRRQSLRFRVAEVSDFPNLDPGDAGRVIPVVYGAPDTYYRAVRTDAGLYGFSISGMVSGTTIVDIRSEFDFTTASGDTFYLHRQDKTVTLSTIQDFRQNVKQTADFRLTLSSPIDYSVPAGALMQEKKTTYTFVMANHKRIPRLGDSLPVDTVFALERLDGSVVEISSDKNTQWSSAGVADTKAMYGDRAEVSMLDAGERLPAIIPRLDLPSNAVDDNIAVTTQPDFSTTEEVEATKVNIPNGPGGSSAAFDGNENTSANIPSGTSVNFTFPSITGGTFTNGDTDRSILVFTSEGTIQWTDAGAVSYITTSGAKGSYRVVAPSEQSFNQTVRAIAQSTGVEVYELEWEHELSTTIDITRDTDAVVGGAVTSDFDGFILEPIRALLIKAGCFGDTAIGGVDHLRSPWQETDTDENDIKVARPTTVFATLQRQLLEGAINQAGSVADADYAPFIDVPAYDAANARYIANDIRFNFVIDKPITWPELEAQLALQARSHAFYGPQGHQLIYIEDDSDLLGITPAAEFFLPGTPDPNAAQSAGTPLMERTSTADVVNTSRVYYQRNNLQDRTRELQDAFRSFLQESNADSLAVYGNRYDAESDLGLWAVSPHVAVGSSAYTASGHASLIAQARADRLAFARTRFAFETGAVAYGLTAGDLVRVAFAVDRNVFRNVICECESVQASPINAERRLIVARSVAVPQIGLTANFTWADLFTSTSDQWTTRIDTGVTWAQLWGVQ